MRKTTMIISGLVFAVVSVLHLLRTAYKIPLTIGNFSLPVWISILGFFIAGILAILNFKYK